MGFSFGLGSFLGAAKSFRGAEEVAGDVDVWMGSVVAVGGTAKGEVKFEIVDTLSVAGGMEVCMLSGKLTGGGNAKNECAAGDEVSGSCLFAM